MSSHSLRSGGLLGAALLLVACGSGAETSATAPAERTTSPGSASATPSAPMSTPSPSAPEVALVAPVLAPTVAWQAGAGEVMPELKELATGLVETAGTWNGAADLPALRDRLVAAGFSPELAPALSPLLDAGVREANVSVVYPQYGGLRDARASVMVTLQQRLAHDDGIHARGRTVDVRLVQTPAGWAVEGAEVATPPAPAQEAGALATAVLANPRITLPEAARADILAGRVEQALLRVMSGLADEHAFEVLALRAGHPDNVFGTERVSNHTVGRAVDVWRLDGHLVADPATPAALIESAMRTAASLGATEVGGPVDLDGPGGMFFSDLVHQDHLHLGIDGE